jgi:hypothetical protein
VTDRWVQCSKQNGSKNLMDTSPDRSLKDEYELLLSKAKELGLEPEARQLKNSYSNIKYHSSNPDEEVRRHNIERFNKIAEEVKEKIRKMQR